MQTSVPISACLRLSDMSVLFTHLHHGWWCMVGVSLAASIEGVLDLYQVFYLHRRPRRLQGELICFADLLLGSYLLKLLG